jgi:NADH-quinone oxidoreductase subunit K
MIDLAPTHYYLLLALFIFAIGVFGIMIRRDVIVVFMCIELVLNSVNLTLVAFSKALSSPDGQVAVIFVMVVAAAEACLGLAIVISLFRSSKTLDTSLVSRLKW